jgi:transposase
VVEEFVLLPTASLACPICGKLAATVSGDMRLRFRTANAGTVVYLLDSSRSHEVPETHFGPQASGVLEVDRYSGYKAMAQVKSGRMVLAFCWAHVRRDFVRVGKGWLELTPWALSGLRRIRQLYRLNRERLRSALGSPEFQRQDA